MNSFMANHPLKPNDIPDHVQTDFLCELEIPSMSGNIRQCQISHSNTLGQGAKKMNQIEGHANTSTGVVHNLVREQNSCETSGLTHHLGKYMHASPVKTAKTYILATCCALKFGTLITKTT
jgi:hypothetical protein